MRLATSTAMLRHTVGQEAGAAGVVPLQDDNVLSTDKSTNSDSVLLLMLNKD